MTSSINQSNLANITKTNSAGFYMDIVLYCNAQLFGPTFINNSVSIL